VQTAGQAGMQHTLPRDAQYVALKALGA
jgi:hypothetical protein